jgi:hypothetical protein
LRRLRALGPIAWEQRYEMRDGLRRQVANDYRITMPAESSREDGLLIANASRQSLKLRSKLHMAASHSGSRDEYVGFRLPSNDKELLQAHAARKGSFA